MSNNVRRTAFTLAEVLITLGIIGIVAAMTMPSLIANYEKKQTLVQLQKVYTELSQAIKLSEGQNGSLENWDFSLSANDFFNHYLKDNIVVVEKYENTAKPRNVNYTYTNGNKANNIEYYQPDTTKYILSNGSILAITNGATGNDFKFIYVDTNGFKKPNKYGKDFFLLMIQPKYGLTPYGFGQAYADRSFGHEYDRSIIAGNHVAACNKTTEGQWCAALILTDGWEIKNDYPW